MPTPRLPTSIHEARGNFNKNPKRGRARENEPVVTDPIGGYPEQFLPDASGFDSTKKKRLRSIWDELMSDVAPGVLNRSHRFHCESLCSLMYIVRHESASTGDRTNLRNCLRDMGIHLLLNPQSSVAPSPRRVARARSRSSHAKPSRKQAESRYVRTAHQYALDVVEGRVLACLWVRLACSRHIEDIASAKTKLYPYKFDEHRASLPCEFMECLPFTEGEWANPRGRRTNRIKLEPWQIFIVCSIFGWVRKTNGRRRFREAYVCIPRKNGKTLLAALIAFYMLILDNEQSPQVYSGATTERQAMELFNPLSRILQMTPEGVELKREFGLEAHTKRILCRYNGGRLAVLVRKPGDGAGSSCAVIDEYHEHPTSILHDTMKQGQRARLQPLVLNITTAGSIIDGPCHQLQQFSQRVLEKQFPNESLFCIIYTIDKDDDWKSDEAARKANPNYGVSLYPETLLQERDDAVNASYLQNAYRTKALNEWMNTGTAWMNMAAWDACADPELRIEDFATEPCDEGEDLSAKIDLASRCKIFKRSVAGKTHYYLFGKHYVPEAVALDGEHQHYAEWVSRKFLTAVPGNEIDLGYIQQEIENDIAAFQYTSLAFDPWSALQMQQALAKQVPEDVVISIPQTVQYLSDPMKEFQAAVLSGRMHHTGDPVLRFGVSCVIAYEDAKRNIFPRKNKSGWNKIDPFSAALTGFARAYVPGEQPSQSVYETRGLRTL